MRFVSAARVLSLAGFDPGHLRHHGRHAYVTVIQTGLKKPTAIEPAGDVRWLCERAIDNAISIHLPHGAWAEQKEKWVGFP
jgi:hypothetical protein